ncbi:MULTISPECIES: CoA transferase [Rhodococcus]|uniref:CoA transferase n=1 Tax=Rhodococcus TaxID=1827 RepID=UPI0002D23353|nr:MULTISPECIES: CoA transferase [Rhodococcus]PND49096.1 2-methylfumaryl-CoA isomerase [Rhodococcus sp. ENV425]USC15084.1 CoA transferase [Rhodococcus sp. 11-3]WKW98450.1 CoA transferase [Rhodococcus aetherivorans]CCW13488.1 putative dehydratase/racemase [Rhodococcus aetherivorans]
MTTRPLEGIRVVDLSSFVAGPTAGRILAELGADVVRVDPVAGAVDGGRWPLAESGASLYWTGLNQAKRSVAVDLRSADGRAVVTELIARSGVVLENAAHAPWLAHEVLAARRPDLIHLHIAGNADGTPAVDYTVNAAVGLPLMTGPVDAAAPVNHVLPAWDLITGVQAALGIVAALRRRDRTGEGAYLELALEDVAVSAVVSMGWLAEAEERGSARDRQGNALYGSYGSDFATADGRAVMVVGLTPAQWRSLVEVTGTAEVFAALERHRGLRFADEGDRYAARDEITAILRPWFAARTLAEIEKELSGSRVLWAPYRTMDEVAAREYAVIERVEQPGVGPVPTARSPLRWDGTYTEARPAPRHGQHTREVLEELGLSPERGDEPGGAR